MAKNPLKWLQYAADVTYVVDSIHSLIPTSLNFADTLGEGSGGWLAENNKILLFLFNQSVQKQSRMRVVSWWEVNYCVADFKFLPGGGGGIMKIKFAWGEYLIDASVYINSDNCILVVVVVCVVVYGVCVCGVWETSDTNSSWKLVINTALTK